MFIEEEVLLHLYFKEELQLLLHANAMKPVCCGQTCVCRTDMQLRG